MDFNYFNQPTSRQILILKILAPLNKLFTRLRLGIEIVRKPENLEMITVEQRINLFHLLNQVLIHNIEGEIIETGCHTGKSAMQIQSMLERFGSDKHFHVYDSFRKTTDPAINIKEIFIINFKNAKLKVPVIHEGYFIDTIPDQLPDKLAFIHIDCSMDTTGQSILKETILHLLQNIYPRMSTNAICLLMDYYDIHRTIGSSNSFPGIKAACDQFFNDKVEEVHVLYGNHFSHGYFRKR